MAGTLFKIPQKMHQFKEYFEAPRMGDLSPIPMRLSDGSGINLREATTTDKVTRITGADEPVVQRVRYSSITVCVNWPGYAGVRSVEKIPVVTQQGSISRATLAMIIAKQVSALITKCGAIPCSSKYAEYRISTLRGLSVNNVYLCGIQNTLDGVWQVDLEAYI